MARKPAYPPLAVHLNGRLVGRLRREASGSIEFRYAPDWIARPNAIPVSTSLPIQENRYTGAPVVAFFDNLLPDDKEIRTRVAERVKSGGTDAYSLLGAIGRDCVGALQFLPENEDAGPTGGIDGRVLDDAEVAAIVRNLAASPLGAGEDPGFRISIAGAQGKTALLRYDGGWMVPHGTTATTHILKPAIGMRRDGLDLRLSVENEHLCMRLTGELGVPVASTGIATFEDQKVLVVERFDRVWTPDGRLLRRPQEDLCQALGIPPTSKYEAEGGPGMRGVMQHLTASDDPEGDRGTFLRAQYVFWLLGATDGHAKNFGQFLASGGRFRLTPLYDILSAQPNVDAHQIKRNLFKLAMSVGDSRHYGIERIARRYFDQAAKLCRFDPAAARRIFDEVDGTASAAIERVLGTLPAEFPAELADQITGGVRARLARGGSTIAADLAEALGDA